MKTVTKPVDRSSSVPAETRSNLSFAGGGRVSVSVSTIIGSERVQQQVKQVREFAASRPAPVKK